MNRFPLLFFRDFLFPGLQPITGKGLQMLAIYMLYGIVVRQKIDLSQLRGHARQSRTVFAQVS